MKYTKRDNGEEFILAAEQHLCCCDCGLVHHIKVRKHKNRFYFRAWRENRRTGQARRWLKSAGHNSLKTKVSGDIEAKTRGQEQVGRCRK